MKYLNDDELMNIDGGGVNVGFVLGVSAFVSFLVGILDGIVRPLKCN